MRVAVVGAGLAGLAAAARLAHAGYRVEVFEKKGYPGGKLAQVTASTERGAFRWDAGATLLTMPHIVDELYTDCGERRQDHLSWLRVDPACRYFWADGKVIDENAAFWRRQEVARYLQHARGVYEIAAQDYLDRPLGEMWRALRPAFWPKLRHLPKVASRKTLAQLHSTFFQDEHLLQIFNRFATYNGSSPYLMPATFSIVPFVQAHFGSWYPKGGMFSLAEQLALLAQRQGAKFFYNNHIQDLTEVAADVVVCNGDVITAHSKWLPDAQLAHALQSQQLSSSAYVLWLAVAKRFPQLTQHNIFFSGNYGREFDEIYRQQKLPKEPTIYLSISARSGDPDAPEGCENWFVMVNAPANLKVNTTGYTDLILARLRSFGVAVAPSDILFRRRCGPRNFHARDNAWGGALYGWASHSLRSSVLRPSMVHKKRKNLFFVGGTTHPGGGIPLVLRSGKIGAQCVQQRFPLKKRR